MSLWLHRHTNRLRHLLLLELPELLPGQPGYRPPAEGPNGRRITTLPEYGLCMLGPEVCLGQGFMTMQRDAGGDTLLPKQSCVAVEEVEAVVMDSHMYRAAWVTETLSFLKTLPFFHHLQKKDLVSLSNAALIKTVNYKEALFQRGDFAQGAGYASVIPN